MQTASSFGPSANVPRHGPRGPQHGCWCPRSALCQGKWQRETGGSENHYSETPGQSQRGRGARALGNLPGDDSRYVHCDRQVQRWPANPLELGQWVLPHSLRKGQPCGTLISASSLQSCETIRVILRAARLRDVVTAELGSTASRVPPG